MNLITSISLSFLFLLQGFGLSVDLCCELPKISNLLEHYEDHNKSYGDSFIDFLEEDYLTFDGSQRHHENSDHEDLPFQGNHNCCGHSLVYHYLEKENVVFTEVVQIKPQYSIYQSTFYSEFLESPFQPPQV